MTYEEHFLVALGITWAVECPLILLSVFLLKIKTVKIYEVVLASFMVSALTLPYLWFIFPQYVNGPLTVWYGEGLVVFAETLLLLWLLKTKIWKAFTISLVVNVLSYFVGKWIL